MTQPRIDSRPRITTYFIRAREGGWLAMLEDGAALAHIRGSNPSMLTAHRVVTEKTGAVVTLVGPVLTAALWGSEPWTYITEDQHDETVARLQAAELEGPSRAA